MASGKATRIKENRKSYLQNGIPNKIKKAIQAHKDKKYILIKKVIGKTDAQACILKCRKQLDTLQNNRLFDR